MSKKILDTVNDYYTKKIKEFGVTPKGVDWNSVESQEIRFRQLCNVIDFDSSCTILDYGCGYGALVDYLNRFTNKIQYTGFDISDEMVAQAVTIHNNLNNAAWTNKIAENEIFDYIITSGIFNVRFEINDEEWKKYVIEVLGKMNKHSKKGFAFNMLTSYSDLEYMKKNLYYADPGFFFDYCKLNFSKYVALLHDYPLYEFTIIVKK